MTAPRYQEVKAPDIPEVKDDDGTHVRVVAEILGKSGPVDGIAADLYIWMCRCRRAEEDAACGVTRHGLRICFAGDGKFCNCFGAARGADGAGQLGGYQASSEADDRSLVLFDRGDEVMVQAGDEGIGFCWCPENRWKSRCVVRPIVMNTRSSCGRRSMSWIRARF